MTEALTYGELFSGFGGLGLAVKDVWPEAELAWYSDVCKFGKDGSVGHHEPHRAPCSIMAHHHPGVPNLGDVTKVDWESVPRVNILTGGSPCQDLSHAGKRAGMTEGTRSNLWVAMREAIAVLRPDLVIWENVRGAYSAEADSALEPCEGCVGDGTGEPVLRALGRVLGDLSDLGYDAVWHGLRAADVGAPHGRFRVFVIAYPQGDTGGVLNRDCAITANADDNRYRPRYASGRRASQSWPEGDLLPTPVLPWPAVWSDRLGRLRARDRSMGTRARTTGSSANSTLNAVLGDAPQASTRTGSPTGRATGQSCSAPSARTRVRRMAHGPSRRPRDRRPGHHAH